MSSLPTTALPDQDAASPEGRHPAAAAPDGEFGALHDSRFTLSQISTLTGLLGLVLLVVVASYMAWNERRILFAEARDHAQQEAYFLAEHAQRLFEVSDVALRATATASSGQDWAALEQSPAVLANMRELSDMLPYVDVLMLADETGLVRRTTLPNAPSHYTIGERTVFREAAQAKADATLIGEPIVGKVTGKPTFLVGRRLEDPDGRFRGLVAASMSLDYFTQFWARLETRNDERIAIVRAGNGSVLARYPESRDAEGERATGNSVLQAAALQPVAGELQPGPGRSGFFHRIGDLPAYVAVVYRDTVVTDQWTARLLAVLPFFTAAIAAMLAILLIGRRLARREAAARDWLSKSNIRLEQSVAERTADLQQTNAEVQRFAYIVSHDLRAPLVNIMGFTSELAAMRGQLFPGPDGGPAATPGLQADFEEALGFIHSSIDKMDRLIKAILALSRQGQRKLKPEPLNMEAVMKSITDGVAHRLMQSGATIVVDPLPPLVADRIAVEQIFSNLVDNAVKYTRPGTPGLVTVRGTASSTTVTYEVQDNGRGIDEKDRERVFELFRRAGRQDQPGDGIGLATVRSLVRRLGGTITLDSRAGMGCAFTVTLPKYGSEHETP